MTWLVRWLIARGLGERAAKRLAVVGAALAAIALLVALWAIYDHFNDKSAVREALAPAEATFRAEQIEAERAAGAAKAARDSADDRSQQDLQEKADEAKRTGGSSLDAVWNGLWPEGDAGRR